jgi:glycosyltransferase involved in cell wall biosynthesis
MAQAHNDLVILMPAYNEARFIGDVVTRALRYGPVIVIDDGSTDETGAAAALAGA